MPWCTDEWKWCLTGDELGEIAVTDKQILLFLALDAYVGTG